MIEVKIFAASSLPVIAAWSITPADATTLVGALSILIAAVFVGLVNIIGARAAARAAVAPIAKKIDQIEPLVTKIDAHVNSEKTRLQGEITNYQAQLEMQRITIDDLKTAAALLAQAKASAEAAKAAVPAVAPPKEVIVVNPPSEPVPIMQTNK